MESMDDDRAYNVAPRVGAWIETREVWGLRDGTPSHPVWVRGLKQSASQNNAGEAIVAPRVGAWIETLRHGTHWERILSHPVWVRGLKLHIGKIPHLYSRVAPRVGAWIETRRATDLD